MRPLVLLLAILSSSAAAQERPNVLLVMVDDMGFSDLGCYGGEVETPNLDGLAAGGVRFTQFYNTGRCWPTRISLMTGKYPHQAGHAMQMGPNAPSPAYAGHTPDRGQFISEYLRDAGYRNYHIGKWHMNNNRLKEKPNPTFPLQRAFDTSYMVISQHNFFNPWKLQDNREIIERPAGESPLGDGSYYLTRDFTDHTLTAIDEHVATHPEDPFFIYLAHTAPHFPLHALPEDIAVYQDGRYDVGWDEIRRQRHQRMSEAGIINTPLSPRDEAAPAWDSLTPGEQEAHATRMAIHAAMIHRVDLGIGRIVDRLRSLDQLDNTLILFLSDNGASAEWLIRGDGHDPEAPAGSGASYLCLEVGWANACNTPFRQHKMWNHEGGISTPLIAHWPAGIEARGELNHQMGHVIDILPTLTELAGIEESPACTGTSLAPALAGEVREDPEFLFWEHTGNRAIRRDNWKLVAEHQGKWELYDMTNDRAENNDLIAEHPELAQELQKQWQQYADELEVVIPDEPNANRDDYRFK